MSPQLSASTHTSQRPWIVKRRRRLIRCLLALESSKESNYTDTARRQMGGRNRRTKAAKPLNKRLCSSLTCGHFHRNTKRFFLAIGTPHSKMAGIREFCSVKRLFALLALAFFYRKTPFCPPAEGVLNMGGGSFIGLSQRVADTSSAYQPAHPPNHTLNFGLDLAFAACSPPK